MWRWRAACVLGLALLLSLAACRVAVDPLEDLGTLGGRFALARAVNDHGVVVGTSSNASSHLGEAFLLNPATGVMEGLGRLTEGGWSEAVDVNDAGVAVGSAEVPSFTFPLQHAFVAEPGAAMTDINDALGSWDESAATAVNDDGVVVGWAVQYFAIDFPVVVRSLDFAYDIDTGTVTPLPISPADINEAGVVVGASGGHAASYDPASGVVTDLGTLGGASSRAEAVNNRGVVVGESQTTNGEFHAFRYHPVVGTMKDLGTLGGTFSTANAINDAGHIVGESSTGSGQRPFFYWPVSRTMTDMGTLGTESFLGATDINRTNVVVGFTRTSDARAWRTQVRFLPNKRT